MRAPASWVACFALVGMTVGATPFVLFFVARFHQWRHMRAARKKWFDSQGH
jgi:hypothetical protein